MMVLGVSDSEDIGHQFKLAVAIMMVNGGHPSPAPVRLLSGAQSPQAGGSEQTPPVNLAQSRAAQILRGGAVDVPAWQPVSGLF
jgi:hypothetical protein